MINLSIDRWTLTNKTSIPLSYPITGVALSPFKKSCIVLYTKLPEEVEHLNIKRRQNILDKLGIVEDPNDNLEEDYPLIIVNKVSSNFSMRDMAKYSFYRKFKNYSQKRGINIENIYSARHLIGGKIETLFVQMRKINTDIRFWAPDRMDITIK